jgi:hypothetical protein
MANGVVDNKPQYSSYRSDDLHRIRPDDCAPYPRPRHGNTVSPSLKPKDPPREQYDGATQSTEVSKEHQTKKENGINDVFFQLSALNKLVNILVSSNLQQGRMMYPQPVVSPPFFPTYSSIVNQPSIS